MPSRKQKATREFWRMVKWILIAGVVMVAGALGYIRAMDAWSLHAVIATVLGVLVSTLLGCGLFALAFLSDKSGHDDEVGNVRSGKSD